jgi:hypothetical protein
MPSVVSNQHSICSIVCCYHTLTRLQPASLYRSEVALVVCHWASSMESGPQHVLCWQAHLQSLAARFLHLLLHLLLLLGADEGVICHLYVQCAILAQLLQSAQLIIAFVAAKYCQSKPCWMVTTTCSASSPPCKAAACQPRAVRGASATPTALRAFLAVLFFLLPGMRGFSFFICLGPCSMEHGTSQSTGVAEVVFQHGHFTVSKQLLTRQPASPVRGRAGHACAISCMVERGKVDATVGHNHGHGHTSVCMLQRLETPLHAFCQLS